MDLQRVIAFLTADATIVVAESIVVIVLLFFVIRFMRQKRAYLKQAEEDSYKAKNDKLEEMLRNSGRNKI